MLLASILDEKLICCRLAGNTREEWYRTMICAASRCLETKLSEKDLLREMMAADNGVLDFFGDSGFCAPHVRLDELNDLYIVVGLPETPVPVSTGAGEMTGQPIRAIVMGFIGANTGKTWQLAVVAFGNYFRNPENLADFASAGTPAAAIRKLLSGNVVLRKEITAEDAMLSPLSVREDISIAEALDLIQGEKRSHVAVVDKDGRLVGELNIIDILKKSVPEFYFKMQSTAFLKGSDPFEKLAQVEKNCRVRDCMRKPEETIRKGTPLVGSIVELCRLRRYALFVVDEQNRLVGELTVRDVICRVLRG